MGRETSHPVSLKEAKERLRKVSTEGELLSWVRQNPAEGVLAAFVLGFLVGAAPEAQQALKDSAILLLKLR